MLAITPPYLRMTFPAGRPSEAERDACPRSVSQALAISLGPALDLAFGLDRDGTFPEAIASRIAALQSGPLGGPAGMTTASAASSA